LARGLPRYQETNPTWRPFPEVTAFRNFAGKTLMAGGWIAWIIIGLIAGWIASKIVNKEGSGILLDLVIGLVGSIIGGVIFQAAGGAGFTGFNLWSLLVAVIGAIILLVIYHAIFGRSRTV
jgi:uncharacterized membrane protein YeaQ/YmgE (transglycosylase-associated protein family)